LCGKKSKSQEAADPLWKTLPGELWIAGGYSHQGKLRCLRRSVLVYALCTGIQLAVEEQEHEHVKKILSCKMWEPQLRKKVQSRGGVIS